MARFEKQVAIISGGADGLGKGIAHRIASERGIVVLLDKNGSLLQKTIRSFSDNGYTVRGYEMDVSLEKDVQQTIQKVLDEFGKVDIMVNSAGLWGRQIRKLLTMKWKSMMKYTG